MTHRPTTRALDIALLGTFQVAIHGIAVTGFRTDKMRALLAYLAVEADRPHRRDALMGLLWPDQPKEAAGVNLRQALFKLRQILGESREPDDANPGWLLVTPLTVQFNPASDHQLDVTTFSALLAACHAHRHRKMAWCTACHARLQQAAMLYRGDFLQEFSLDDSPPFDEWLVLQREELRREALEVFGLLALYHEMHGEYLPALQYTYRRLELEPWDEELHQQAMGLLATTGRRSAALAQYQACKQILARELDVAPTAETTALFERIRAGAPVESLNVLRAAIHQHNLPHQLTPFIGRTADLRQVVECLEGPDYRLVTLIGPGGVGKTRLALQAAETQLGAFAAGVYCVSLAAVLPSAQLPHLLATAIAQAIGLSFHGHDEPQTQLLQYLRDKEMLLVLDNFEHLLGPRAEAPGPAESLTAIDLLLAILQQAQRISLLVTSRERLGLQAEFLLDLTGLQVPTLPGAAAGLASQSQDRDDMTMLLASSAVQLFVARARQAHPAFTLSYDTAPGVVDICRLVGGLPLGIVLAAAWVRHLPPARIAAAIQANLDFLTSPARDTAPQHRSLRAVFEHSWQLLTPAEQHALRNLAVFRGGWDAAAAERIAGAPLPVLLSLVDKSLLRSTGAEQFEIHEVLRQYAGEKLQELPAEHAAVRQAHAQYYLALAELAEAGLKGEEQEHWLARLEREHDNLRAALSWARENTDVALGLRLAAALSRFWYVRGYYGEGRAALAEVLSAPWQDQVAPGVRAYRAKALLAAGDLARAQGDYAQARLLCDESLALYRELGNQKDIAIALVRRAIVAWNQGEHPLARALYDESLTISRELGDKKDLSVALGNLGTMAFVDGDYDTARVMLEESIALCRELGDTFNLAIRLNNLGNVALLEEHYAAARTLHAEGLALRRELGDQWGIAVSLVGLGAAAVGVGAPERGTRVLGAAAALLAAIGATLEADDRIPYERGTAAARRHLDAAEFAQAWATGSRMKLEEALSQALQD